MCIVLTTKNFEEFSRIKYLITGYDYDILYAFFCSIISRSEGKIRAPINTD